MRINFLYSRYLPLLILLITIFSISTPLLSTEIESSAHSSTLIESSSFYQDTHLDGILDKLAFRINSQPFNLISMIIFACAILHALLANNFLVLAKKSKQRHDIQLEKLYPKLSIEERKKHICFSSEIFHLLGEVEVVFAIWVLPLLFALWNYFGWSTAIHYLDSRQFTEPLFVIVIMVIASTPPIVQFAERILEKVASLGGGSAAAWWVTILVLGPLMGSLITEPAAMTISAMLLSKKFYDLRPSNRLAYATLGLLFVNISVGGVLTHFAAPPVLMVAHSFGWDTPFMLITFGWKAVIGILVATTLYFAFFYKELKELNEKASKQIHTPPAQQSPYWITIIHLLLLVWVVAHSHYTAVFVSAFLFFLGFHHITRPYQAPLSLKQPLLVGIFLAGLITHGGLQGWWIAPIISGLNEVVLTNIAIILTAFNDNAAITYLTTLIPNFSDELKYAAVSGAVIGGGLTVLANAPNPAGQAILNRHFNGAISPAKLFLGAIIPTLIMNFIFTTLR